MATATDFLFDVLDVQYTLTGCTVTLRLVPPPDYASDYDPSRRYAIEHLTMEQVSFFRPGARVNLHDPAHLPASLLGLPYRLLGEEG